MSVLEDYFSKVPEYYDRMYLDDYSPYEILYSVHEKIFSDLKKQEQPEITNIIFRTEIKSK